MTTERTEKITRVLNNRQPDLALIMENVHDPHNISAVMRTCDAVGVQEIFVLNTEIPRHKRFGRKSSSSAMGWLTIHQYEDIDECMGAVKKRFTSIYATHLGVTSSSLYDLDLAASVALVFGNEHKGVSDACLQYCDGNFIIPQAGMVQSLNISVACAVTLYEAFRQRTLAGYYENNTSRLPAEQLRELAVKWRCYDGIPGANQ